GRRGRRRRRWGGGRLQRRRGRGRRLARRRRALRSGQRRLELLDAGEQRADRRLQRRRGRLDQRELELGALVGTRLDRLQRGGQDLEQPDDGDPRYPGGLLGQAGV